VTILEGVNLAAVPEGDYQLFCGPLVIPGSDGAPARVFLVG
jgi:arylformamidase